MARGRGTIYGWRYQTPEGFDDLLMNSDGKALTGLWFEGSRDSLRHELASEERPLEIFAETSRWLDQYFAGKEPDFTPKYKLGRVSPFRREVLGMLAEIRFGQVKSYQELAERLMRQHGGQMSAQAIGGAVGANPICLILPCHRVVGKNGNLVGYSGGIENKIALLQHEGVIF